MARSRRVSDPDLQIARLERKHAELDARVSELTERTYLTSSEQMEAQRLKKEKLVLKERLDHFRS